MELAEYATMAEVEERHWWYRALRAVITEAWTRHVQGGTAPALLDVGCGTGANLLALRDRARPCGIDFSPEAVHWCRSRGLAATAVASAASLPFGPERFDVVLSCDVLCHGSLPDKEAPLAEMARVLKPGGVLLLNLPAFQWLYSSHDRAYHTDRRFTRGEVRALLERAGLEPVRVIYWNSVLFPVAAGVRLLRRFTKPEGSDLAAGSAAAGGPLFDAAFALERALRRHVSLPFGVSVFAAARKPGG